MKLSIAEVERQFCAHANHSLPDFTVRNSYLGKAGLLSRGGRGPNAPIATARDFGVMTLGLISSRQAKTVVSGFERTRALKLSVHRLETGGWSKISEPPVPIGTSLEDAIIYCIHLCATDKLFRLIELRVEQSEFNPNALLAFTYFEEGASAGFEKATCMMWFSSPSAPEGCQPSAIEYSARIQEHALMTMVELFAINIQPERENGPPAGTGEPVSFDTRLPDDKPRGGNPEAQHGLSRSRVCVNDVQPRSRSRGRSSGGPSIPRRETADDAPPDRRPDTVATPAA